MQFFTYYISTSFSKTYQNIYRENEFIINKIVKKKHFNQIENQIKLILLIRNKLIKFKRKVLK